MREQHDQVSVEEALQHGFWTVQVPSMAALFIPIAAFIALAKLGYIPSIAYPGMKWAVPTFLAALTAAWLIWSVQVPRWRLWAYRRVRDIALLKQRAVESQLIWPDSSIFTRTEIMSSGIRAELEQLERRA
jgi:hypothetical protein